ncbi:ABC transporter ATP-binding protein [Nocardioides sp.]|uniref:ABC transporter ATP-binding protein n=1 Tax=Nocardioides sp. TaxID=35761 RepID=UPI0039E4A883
MAMLELAGLVAGYGGVRVLHGVDLVVAEGETVTLLGANGAGKTTLLKAIAGDVRPTGGTISFEGRNVTGDRAEVMARAGVAHIPEGRDVFARLSVEENLRLGGYLRGDKQALREDIDQVYDRFPVLGDRRSQLAGTLSGGEQQMLAIARALVGRPRLIMLDEPSLGLSPVMVGAVFDLVAELKQDGLTVLLVEQNTRNALRVADRAYVLATGRVVYAGAAAELAADTDLLHAAYLGRRSAREEIDGTDSSVGTLPH